MFPRSPKVDEERRRKAKICAQGFALAYRNSSRNEPAPMEAEEQQHSAEHHHHSSELTQQTPEDPPPLIRRSGRQRTERAAQTRSARRVPQAEQSTSEKYSAEQLDVPNEYNPPQSNAPAYTQGSMDEFARIYFS